MFVEHSLGHFAVVRVVAVAGLVVAAAAEQPVSALPLHADAAAAAAAAVADAVPFAVEPNVFVVAEDVVEVGLVLAYLERLVGTSVAPWSSRACRFVAPSLGVHAALELDAVEARFAGYSLVGRMLAKYGIYVLEAMYCPVKEILIQNGATEAIFRQFLRQTRLGPISASITVRLVTAVCKVGTSLHGWLREGQRSSQ